MPGVRPEAPRLTSVAEGDCLSCAQPTRRERVQLCSSNAGSHASTLDCGEAHLRLACILERLGKSQLRAMQPFYNCFLSDVLRGLLG